MTLLEYYPDTDNPKYSIAKVHIKGAGIDKIIMVKFILFNNLVKKLSPDSLEIITNHGLKKAQILSFLRATIQKGKNSISTN